MISQNSRNKQRLIHITEACSKISFYVTEIDQEAFLLDSKVQDAVLYQLIVIGEAVVHIDNDLLEKYPYSWFKIKALRNYAAHEYFNIQMWTIWDITSTHITQLHEIVNEILDKEF
jgi:uncharacterized protein with HEPN domain